MAAILGPGGPSMARKIATDGPGGPILGGTIGGMTELNSMTSVLTGVTVYAVVWTPGVTALLFRMLRCLIGLALGALLT